MALARLMFPVGRCVTSRTTILPAVPDALSSRCGRSFVGGGPMTIADPIFAQILASKAPIVGLPANCRGLTLSASRKTNSSVEENVPTWGAVAFDKVFKVPTFGGSVWIKTNVDVQIKGAGTAEYPSLDEVQVKVLSSSSQEEVNNSGENIKVGISQEGHQLSLLATSEEGFDIGDNGKLMLELWVPIVHNINVEAFGNAKVEIFEVYESNFVNVKADKGPVTFHSIKTENLSVNTVSGDIHGVGSIQGNVILHSRSGNVITEKRIRGPNADIETVDGDIRIASSYAELSKFTTVKGSLHLRNIHNESYIAIYDQGTLKALGIDGSTNVFVKKGDCDIHVSRINLESRVHVEEGDIHLRLSDDHPLKLHVEGNDVIPDTKYKALGELSKRAESEHIQYFAAIVPNVFSPSFSVIAENGNVLLDSQDWAASLGLKLGPKAKKS